MSGYHAADVTVQGAGGQEHHMAAYVPCDATEVRRIVDLDAVTDAELLAEIQRRLDLDDA